MIDPERHRGDEAKERLIRSLALVVAGVVVVLSVGAAVIPDIVIAKVAADSLKSAIWMSQESQNETR